MHVRNFEKETFAHVGWLHWAWQKKNLHNPWMNQLFQWMNRIPIKQSPRRIDRFYSYSLLEGESCDRSTMTSYTAYTVANDREQSGPRVAMHILNGSQRGLYV